jgi:hypothetical protein
MFLSKASRSIITTRKPRRLISGITTRDLCFDGRDRVRHFSMYLAQPLTPNFLEGVRGLSLSETGIILQRARWEFPDGNPLQPHSIRGAVFSLRRCW